MKITRKNTYLKLSNFFLDKYSFESKLLTIESLFWKRLSSKRQNFPKRVFIINIPNNKFRVIFAILTWCLKQVQILNFSKIVLFFTGLFLDGTNSNTVEFCQKDLPKGSNAYGDWIFLNGSQNVLIEYQVHILLNISYLLVLFRLIDLIIRQVLK